MATSIVKPEDEIKRAIESLKNKMDELIIKHAEEGKKGEKDVTHVSDEISIQSEAEMKVQTIKLPFLGNPSWITGITILPSGKILLVDHTNAVVTVLNLSLICICSTNIHPAPYDITSISSTEDHVMLSVPDTRELVRCDLLEDGSVLVGQKLKTNITCKAMASDGGHVAVCSNSELVIFERDGEVWMMVLDESYATAKFIYIAIASSERKVFITDHSYPEPHIKCIDFDGAVLWKLADGRINLCTGICVMGTRIMAMSWDSGKMFTFLFNGGDLETYSKNTVVTYPWKLHISSKQNSIYVSQHKNTLSEEDKRTVSVFIKV